MKNTKGDTGLAKKPRKNMLDPNSIYVGVKLDPKIAARIRIIAASRGISFAKFTRELLPIGLNEYLKSGHLDLGALEAVETSASINAARAEAI